MPFPTCRHAEGTISSSGVPDVWRMASEDSDQLVPRFLAIHRLSDLCNFDQSIRRQMAAGINHLDARRELLEVLLLRAHERIPARERNDRFA